MRIVIIRLVLCAQILAALGCEFILPARAYAATPAPTIITVQETPPPSSAPDLIITSLIGSALPQYIELYNQGDTPIHLHDWNVAITVHDTSPLPGCTDVNTNLELPDGWLLSRKYLTLEQTTTPSQTSLTMPFALDAASLLGGCITPKLATVAILRSAEDSEQLVAINPTEWSATATTVAQHRQRSNSPNSTRTITGVFDTDYKIVTGAITLNSDSLYTPPADLAGLQLLEILPNAKSCSPLSTDQTCSDYIKLYNSSDQPINLALYRLRAGTKGQSEGITNTFTWNKQLDPLNDELIMPPATYFMLTMRNDGQPLSITDSGNFVWLEDAYGTAVYEPIVAYPDASSATKIGQAWAYTGSLWQWTSSPMPGAANYFPPVVTTPPASNSSASVSIEATLKPCAEGQYRNPATNRCNTIVTVAAAALAPCDEGEERNPLTHRCRSTVTVATELTPCPTGEERNPITNRCRQAAAVAGAATDIPAVKDVASPVIDRTGWFVAAATVMCTLGYALYEWRQEMRLGLRRAQSWATAALFHR